MSSPFQKMFSSKSPLPKEKDPRERKKDTIRVGKKYKEGDGG